jgi:uncharacterized protein YkwD
LPRSTGNDILEVGVEGIGVYFLRSCLKRLFLLILAVVCLVLTPGGAQEETSAAQLLLQKINAARAQHGVPGVQVDARLTQAAQRHNTEMAQQGYFGHYSSNPEFHRPQERARRAGYKWKNIFENIYRTGATDMDALASETVGYWNESATHRENMLDRQAEDIGIAIDKHRDGDFVITVMLGRD